MALPASLRPVVLRSWFGALDGPLGERSLPTASWRPAFLPSCLPVSSYNAAVPEQTDDGAPRQRGQEALDAVWPEVYQELRRLAAYYVRGERADLTLQATALVHEAYVRLLKEANTSWSNRAHFAAIAANAMRQILVEQSRAHRALKRGGDHLRVTLVDDAARQPEADPDVEALDEALTVLSALEPRQARLVELRYFGGLTIEEASAELGVAPATAKRDWAVARAWLRRRLQPDAPS
jgi:RNA polymerase sigma-70 factor (ECF subfamily)